MDGVTIVAGDCIYLCFFGDAPIALLISVMLSMFLLGTSHGNFRRFP